MSAEVAREIEQLRRDGKLADAGQKIIDTAKRRGGMDAFLTHQYALTLMANGNFAEARDTFVLLTQKFPHGALLWFNIGRCSEIMGDYEVARHAFRVAIQSYREKPGQPDEARSWFGMGAVLFRLGEDGNAESFWRDGLEKPCDSDNGIFERSQVKLALGMYTTDAWQDYEYRKKLMGYQQGLKARVKNWDTPPEWTGDRRWRGVVAAVGGQGAGDVIMFSRYLPAVEELTEMRPCLFAGEPLERFLGYRSSGGMAWCALDSLPLLLRRLEPIPPHCADPWRRPWNTKPRVGVCWKGSPHHLNDKDRSSPTDFRFALKDDRWEIVSLQEGKGFHPKDYQETAELMRTLDAVVTVDTSVVHLAGTLGVPTVLIPPTCPEWRWGISGETTPWYPSVRIVRRKRWDEWDGAIQRAKQKLEELL